MATTTNYSWTTPDDTALVKDGAAAIRSLGTAIDTTVFNNASATIAKTIVDAKGDIIAATAADTVSRLAVGANDTVLTADSSTATGLKWAAAAGGKSFTLLNAGGTSLSGLSTLTVSGISAKDDIYILGYGVSGAAYEDVRLTINSDTSNKYGILGSENNPASTYVVSRFSTMSNLPDSTGYMFIAGQSSNAADQMDFMIRISGANSTNIKMLTVLSGASNSSGNGSQARYGGGLYSGTSAVSSITIASGYSGYDAGTIYVYTSA